MTVTQLVEGLHAGEYLVSEIGRLSRDVGTITGGAVLTAGTVLGEILLGAESSAMGTNTGNGALGAVTVSAKALVGVYSWKITKAAAGAGDFELIDPNDEVAGVGTAGVPFSGGGLAYTLGVGGTNWAVGDGGTITIAPGSNKFEQLNLSGADGSQIAAAILFEKTDATLADVPATINSRLCEVNPAQLTWPAGITTTQKAIAIAQLAQRFIIMRA